MSNIKGIFFILFGAIAFLAGLVELKSSNLLLTSILMFLALVFWVPGSVVFGKWIEERVMIMRKRHKK